MNRDIDRNPLSELLLAGLNELELPHSDLQIQQLLTYLSLFSKWNKAYNLTAITKPEDMVKLHLLDSLAIAPHLVGERHIDVGTGPGLPGIPLAIYFPRQQFTLLDSNGKKTRFLMQVKQDLGLNNVEIIHARAENFSVSNAFDTVLSRAFASLNDMVNYSAHLCSKNGRFFALKGVYPGDEIAELSQKFTIEKVIPLTVPGFEGQRHLIIISQILD